MACHRRPMARTTATTRAIEMAPNVSAESEASLVRPSRPAVRWSASQLVASMSPRPIGPDSSRSVMRNPSPIITVATTT